MAALRDEAAKLVQSLAIERVRILDAEPTYQTSVSSVYQRIALETVLNLGTTEAGIDCMRLSRARLRSILSLPRGGQLVSLVAQVTPQVGSHWGPRKRDLAALAALAAEREA
ncbi:hypothetical protein ACFQZ8_03950 [Micromonospora azadirachtae]|uniref:DUF222 domain-containing protein n=1 Tax=Micromonospora azadirachtae TaxID=1970735 RepID=A0ABW2ZWZ0_9ACTN